MSFVDYEQDGNIAVLTINRPKALNALNSEVLSDLENTIDNIDLDTVRALIITGAGEKSFVAGADIDAMSNMTKEEAREFSKLGNDVFRKIEQLDIPVIAAVNGFALGGGNELAMSADIRLASDNALFGQPETGLGITPGFGGTQRLMRLIPVGFAKEMIYAGTNIKADKAKDLGLVNEIYSIEELMPAAKKLASKIANNAPIANREAKHAMNTGIDQPMDEALATEVVDFGECFESDDQKEGMAAFLEKRKHEPFQNK